MIIWEIAAKCTIPFKDIENNYSVMFQIVSKNKRENIPNDTPENVRDIIEQCWKSNPSERITLSNILEKAGGDNLLEPIAQVQQPPK
jgi:hypothetical protein